jgi:S1-C subfamily serine protease
LSEVETNHRSDSSDSETSTDRRRGARTGWILTGAALFAALSFLAGVLVARGTPTTAPPAKSADEPATTVARLLLPSAVFIKAGDGAGSGFIYRSDGYVITAAHVVRDNKEVTIRLFDGAPLKGKVLGKDTARDVAVIKVKRTGLRAAKLARNLPVRVGQLAIAVGSPYRLEASVTSGIVSAVDRSVPTANGYVRAIQTDAPINPGNSGGPLADRLGRVIGINFEVKPNSTGVGFAVPIDVAWQAVSKIQVGKKPPPVAFLGVSGTDSLDDRAGALLTEVTPGSGAANAGLRAGDLVITVDGEAIRSMSEFANKIRVHTPGETMKVTYLRDKKRTTVNVKVGSRPGSGA